MTTRRPLLTVSTPMDLTLIRIILTNWRREKPINVLKEKKTPHVFEQTLTFNVSVSAEGLMLQF